MFFFSNIFTTVTNSTCKEGLSMSIGQSKQGRSLQDQLQLFKREISLVDPPNHDASINSVHFHSTQRKNPLHMPKNLVW